MCDALLLVHQKVAMCPPLLCSQQRHSGTCICRNWYNNFSTDTGGCKASAWEATSPKTWSMCGWDVHTFEADICLGFTSQFVWIHTLIQCAVLTDTEDRENGINGTERGASFTYNPNALLPKFAWFLLQNRLHNFPPHYYLITPAIKILLERTFIFEIAKNTTTRWWFSPLVRSGGGTSLQRADSRARQSLGRGMYRLGTFGKWCAWATITASLNVV